MKRFWTLTILVLAAALALTITPVSAQDGRTAFGEPVTVRSGETVNGDLVAFGGPVTVEQDGRVNGNAVAIGGPLTIAGHITGDAVALGGPISLRGSAVVDGDLVSTGAPISRDPGAVVRGDVIEGFRFQDLRNFRFGIPGVPPAPPAPGTTVEVPGGSGFLSFVGNLLVDGFIAAGLALLALLLLIFIPDQTNRVKRMTEQQPLASAGLGCLTMLVIALLLVALVLTVCGIPIAAILGIAFVVALVYGWLALGIMIGERLLAALNTERPLPLISGVVGVLLISLLSLWVPCLGGLLGLIGLSWGLGAVVLSRGGMQSYPSLPGGRVLGPAAPTSPAPPAPPAAEAPPESEEETEIREQPEALLAEPEPEASALDDLQAIKGIGPVYERLLREAGIRTYGDLTVREPHELVEAVNEPNVVPVSIKEAQSWIEEAGRLADVQSA